MTTDWTLAPTERWELGQKVTGEEAEAMQELGIEVDDDQIGSPEHDWLRAKEREESGPHAR